VFSHRNRGASALDQPSPAMVRMCSGPRTSTVSPNPSGRSLTMTRRCRRSQPVGPPRGEAGCQPRSSAPRAERWGHRLSQSSPERPLVAMAARGRASVGGSAGSPSVTPRGCSLSTESPTSAMAMVSPGIVGAARGPERGRREDRPDVGEPDSVGRVERGSDDIGKRCHQHRQEHQRAEIQEHAELPVFHARDLPSREVGPVRGRMRRSGRLSRRGRFRQMHRIVGAVSSTAALLGGT
jgi:hypothetical protein